MIVGIDGGGDSVKIVGQHGEMKFPSALGEYRDLVGETFREGSIVYEYEGKRGFAGTLAQNESEFVCSMLGDTKAHEDTKLRILIGLHLYGGREMDFSIVVGQPISTHTPEEKEKIKRMLLGKHDITVNGVTKTINIEKVTVSLEGAASFFCNIEEGVIRIIDVGSGTINLASIIDGKFVDKDSFTIDLGINSTKQIDFSALSRLIIAKTSRKWKKSDKVYVVGGVAEYITSYVDKHYKWAKPIYPIIRNENEAYTIEPVYSNAYGFYELGKRVYGNER